MNTYAFVSLPTDVNQIRHFWPLARIMPDLFIRQYFKYIFPPKAFPIQKMRSRQGEEINGFYIVLPILLEQLHELRQDFLADRIAVTKALAQRLGAGILGLDTDLFLLSEQFSTIAKNPQISVTDGNSLTAWSMFEAVYRSARTKGINLKKSTLLVFNACSPVGWLCAEKSAEYVQKLILNDTKNEKLSTLRDMLSSMHSCEVVIDDVPSHAIENADIIIVPSNYSQFDQILKELNSKGFTNKLIISDAHHTDAPFIQGGLIKLVNRINLKVDRALPADIVGAALAQTMLSAFTGIFWNYALNENINLHELEEVADIAVVYDFEVWLPEAPLI